MDPRKPNPSAGQKLKEFARPPGPVYARRRDKKPANRGGEAKPRILHIPRLGDGH